MAKYKLLSQEELKEFKNEFIQYLIVNGIDAASWEKMKSEQPQHAAQILALFSDVVYEKILRKAKYLINAFNNTLFAFHYKETEAELIIVKLKTDMHVEWTNHEGLLKKVQTKPSDFAIHQQVKAYVKTREQEVLEMMESGCKIDEGDLFNKLKLYLSTKSN